MGLNSTSDICANHIMQKSANNKIQSLSEIYHFISDNCLLKERTVPDNYRLDWHASRAYHF